MYFYGSGVATHPSNRACKRRLCDSTVRFDHAKRACYRFETAAWGHEGISTTQLDRISTSPSMRSVHFDYICWLESMTSLIHEFRAHLSRRGTMSKSTATASAGSILGAVCLPLTATASWWPRSSRVLISASARSDREETISIGIRPWRVRPAICTSVGNVRSTCDWAYCCGKSLPSTRGGSVHSNAEWSPIAMAIRRPAFRRKVGIDPTESLVPFLRGGSCRLLHPSSAHEKSLAGRSGRMCSAKTARRRLEEADG